MNRKEREQGKLWILAGGLALLAFTLWTILVVTIDVQGAGETGSPVGFATFNTWFHTLTGVHFALYRVTDWLGLVPVLVCLFFAGLGMAQLLCRKTLRRVDVDLLLLGLYYGLVILAYLLFEEYPVNYRPVFIDGRVEASYPSSTTLLVLAVMPTLILQANRRLNSRKAKTRIAVLTVFFTVLMVVGRLISGVHWCTDIVGAILLSTGFFCSYKGAMLRYCKPKQ